MMYLNLKMTAIQLLCHKYRVQKLYAFGSVLGTNFRSDSDIDLIVKFDEKGLEPEYIGDLYWNLLDELETILGRKVDLMKDKIIKNPYLKAEIENTKKIIYDRQDTEIFV